jgi:hydrogenase maturation protease
MDTTVRAQQFVPFPAEAVGEALAGPSVLVIGYGNPLRGDDGLGWYAAEQLADSLTVEGVTILAHHQLTPELAEAISRVDLALFIDARCDGRPGELRCEAVAPNQPSSGSFTHQFDPPALLTCAQALYGACPAAFLLSVTGVSFGYEEALSEPVLGAVPRLLERIHELIDGRR